MITLSEFHRQLSGSVELNRGLLISAETAELFRRCGALAALSVAADQERVIFEATANEHRQSSPEFPTRMDAEKTLARVRRMLAPQPLSLSGLQRRFSRALESGKAFRIDGKDMGLFVESGAYAALAAAAAEEQATAVAARASPRLGRHEIERDVEDDGEAAARQELMWQSARERARRRLGLI